VETSLTDLKVSDEKATEGMSKTIVDKLLKCCMYELAVYGVDEAHLSQQKICQLFQTKLDELIAECEDAKDCMEMERVQAYTNALKNLKTQLQDPMLLRLNQLQSHIQGQVEVKGLELVEASMKFCQDSISRMEDREQEFTTFITQFNQKTKDRWALVTNMDLCAPIEETENILHYLEDLKYTRTFLANSGTMRAMELARPSESKRRGKRKKVNIHQRALELIRKGIQETITETNVSLLFDEAHDNERLRNVYDNLDLLGKNEPETKARAAKDLLCTMLQKKITDLEAGVFALYQKLIQYADASLKKQRKLNFTREFERLETIRKSFQSARDVIPESKRSGILQRLLDDAKKQHDDFRLELRQNPQLQPQQVVETLMGLYRILTLVPDESIKDEVRDYMTQILNKLRVRKYNFTALYQELESWDLPGETSYGGEITAYFDHFKQHKIDLMNQKIRGMTFEDSLNALCQKNPAPGSPAWVVNQENKDFKSKIDAPRRQALETTWASYEQHFNGIVRKYLFRPDLQELYRRVTSDARSLQNDFSNENVAKVLAGVCAAVSLHGRVKEGSSTEAKVAQDSLIQLHAVQLLGLFRLLGVDKPPRPERKGIFTGIKRTFGFASAMLGEDFNNHLIEILTGQGKSYVLCVLSITMALLDFQVDCVCYSKILRDRDHAAFVDLFNDFGIQAKIDYCTFSQLARREFMSAGDVATGTQSLLDNKVQLVSSSRQIREKILLIDEVDVFFNQDFYGNMYTPSLLWKAPEVLTILQYVWDQRAADVSLQHVMQLPQYDALAIRFPDLIPLLKANIRQMLQASKDFQTAEYKYVVQDGKIGYEEHGSVNTNITHGYRTTFSYFCEREKGVLTQEQWEHGICGHFSYAELPKKYKRILGVTGTLKSLGNFERKEMQREYKITEETLIPSFFGERDSNFFQGVDLLQTQNDFHHKIEQELIACRDAKRAVIVFFESEARIQAFLNSSYGSRIKHDLSVVTEKQAKKIDHYVKQATRSEAITLFPRVYGRGLDFSCYDTIVQSSNGVHVVQCFLSADISEETQIQGRTCRQGQKGTYKMILWAQDLTQWKPDGIQQANNPDEKVPSFVSEAEVQQIMQTSATEQYQALNAKRVQWFQTLAEERRQRVQDAMQTHEQTLQYQRKLKNPWGRESELMQSLQRLNTSATQSAASGLNIVFCLDESGSMRNDWEDLVTAFKAFLAVRGSQAADDVISVVQFSHVLSSPTLTYATLAEAQNADLTFHGGGTKFKPPLQQALHLFRQSNRPSPRQTRHSQPTQLQHADKTKVLVFMSDGANDDGGVGTEMKNLVAACPGLKFFSIFFGSNASPRLQEMASAVPGGKYAQSLDASALQEEFVEIAESISGISYVG
jgi:Mg-chelatase subunit ChlD